MMSPKLTQRIIFILSSIIGDKEEKKKSKFIQFARIWLNLKVSFCGTISIFVNKWFRNFRIIKLNNMIELKRYWVQRINSPVLWLYRNTGSLFWKWAASVSNFILMRKSSIKWRVGDSKFWRKSRGTRWAGRNCNSMGIPHKINKFNIVEIEKKKSNRSWNKTWGSITPFLTS